MELSKRQNILGVQISAVAMQPTLEWISRQIESRIPHYICCAPAHAIMNCVDDPSLREIYNHSGLTTPDGMPIAWLLRWYGYREVERVYGPDLLLAACGFGLERGWRHFFYGGTPEITNLLLQRLSVRFPGLQVAGVINPPFRSLSLEEERDMRVVISEARPDILWVGIGSPRQERWMAQHVNNLSVPVMVGVGAAFDFLSGVKPQAPRWVQRSGLEWLFRLASEPKRLWRRYLLNYPRFVALILLQLLNLRSFPA
jgi:N-acetylglucosaminyldiphosphoundecaprenol N-acetyl-beta-D-mannosaminyltransferase